jgi:transcription initiation factor IIE alpha subunit
MKKCSRCGAPLRTYEQKDWQVSQQEYLDKLEQERLKRDEKTQEILKSTDPIAIPRSYLDDIVKAKVRYTQSENRYYLLIKLKDLEKAIAKKEENESLVKIFDCVNRRIKWLKDGVYDRVVRYW